MIVVGSIEIAKDASANVIDFGHGEPPSCLLALCQAVRVAGDLDREGMISRDSECMIVVANSNLQ